MYRKSAVAFDQTNLTYYRFLGKSAGRPVRFWLGRDESEAKIRAGRLELFWQALNAAEWTAEGLQQAKAIAKGEIDQPRELALRWLRQREDAAAGTIRKADGALDRIVSAASTPRYNGALGTLHAALDDWHSWLGQQRDESGHWGKVQEGARRFQNHHDDMPLSDLGERRMRDMLRYWADRPQGKRGRLSVSSSDWHLKRLKSFFRWLHSEEKYGWRKPSDFAEWRFPIKRDDTDDGEIPVFSLDELTTLYARACPLVRAFMLLALNCGFKHAEISSLRRSEIRDGKIIRLRGKTGVKAEWKLWKETTAALNWAMSRTKKAELVFVTADGSPFNERGRLNRIANLWVSGRPRLSFKHLEKTAATWIRANYSSELASMFCAHGSPHKADRILEVYAGKPWRRLAEATDALRVWLQPMF